MYLAFIDESGTVQENDPQSDYYVLVAVVTHHSIILITKPQINKSFINRLRLFLSEISEVVIHPPQDKDEKKINNAVNKSLF